MIRHSLRHRENWQDHAKEQGFSFYEMHGKPYWNEGNAYSFTLRQIEDDLEDPSTELHEMCLSLVDRIINGGLMAKFGIPEEHWDYVSNSWGADRDRHLYGRFDLAYNGLGPAKLLEYNCDTPTSLYEASSYQWSWLEAALEADIVPSGADQFNSIHEALVDRFRGLRTEEGKMHFSSTGFSEEDYATTEYLAWCAREANITPYFTELEKIGISPEGWFLDSDAQVMRDLFVLYPWEDIFRDDFSKDLADSHCRFIEPAWKSLLSNKAILPLLWENFEGHPNLLPAYFDVEGASEKFGRKGSFVRKPIFSREGSSVDITIGGEKYLSSQDRSYAGNPCIIQEYVELPCFEGHHPVLGTWIVGDKCVGMGIRDDESRITQDLSLFTPHFILD